MADLNHSTLADDKIHQPKGASSATINHVLTSNGDGTTRFSALPTTSLVYADTITSFSTVAQEMAAVDDTIRVAFAGTSESSPSGAISIAPGGTITFNQAGTYAVELAVSCSRTTDTGVVTLVLNNELNGMKSDTSRVVSLTNSTDAIPLGADLNGLLTVSAGDTIAFNMLRLAGTDGSAGIYSTVVANASFSDVPSAFLRVGKIEVA